MFHTIWLLGPIGAIVGLLAAYLFFQQMMKESEGTETMIEIAGHVREGAHAYLRQQNRVVGLILVVTFVALLVLSLARLQAIQVPFAFILGGAFSALAGYLGMVTATNASARTSNAARERGLNQALKIAFRSGAVMGLTVVGLALAFIVVAFFLMVKFSGLELKEATIIMVSFGMGASFQALFARVGGGIFTKAADVGADLVGKVEAGIPEDDPRNPATIADNVGDNVGDVAGMGADLYESYSSSILAAIALGVSAFSLFPDTNFDDQMAAAIAPIAISGLGIIASVIGIFMVKTREGANQKELIHALDRGVWIASIVMVAGSAAIFWDLLKDVDMPNRLGWLGLWGCVVLGLAVGLGIGKATEYYTSYDYQPTQLISAAGVTGPATVIIEGFAVGLLSTYMPILFVILGILGSFILCNGFLNVGLGLYGVALAAVGMLSTLGITLATDAYGPIADNAGGNAEMADLPPEVREKTDLLDAVGNTTAAIGKGFAIGSAALTAMALLAAYGEELKIRLISATTTGSFNPWGANQINHEQAVAATYQDLMLWYDVTLLNPMVLIGLFIGATLVFVFSALTMKAVGKSAMSMIEEVRRQFREKPGILQGEEKPDYAACVAISTADAQRQMVLPSVLVVAVPMIVGMIFGPAAVMGLLTGGLVCGFLMAIMMANAGGAWDNAKKYVELGNNGGKGSEAHRAGIIGDTVGDPFKDTSGPALNVLIKLMAIASVVFAGLTVNISPKIAAMLGFF
ncbi:MAG: sodium-translocating pyrophosphatase [Vulcanimicrobiota bacterium]